MLARSTRNTGAQQRRNEERTRPAVMTMHSWRCRSRSVRFKQPLRPRFARAVAVIVTRKRIELPTRAFTMRCSTTELPRHVYNGRDPKKAT